MELTVALPLVPWKGCRTRSLGWKPVVGYADHALILNSLLHTLENKEMSKKRALKHTLFTVFK